MLALSFTFVVDYIPVIIIISKAIKMVELCPIVTATVLHLICFIRAVKL